MTAGSRKTALAIFVKTPGLSSIKTRLAADIGVEDATTMYLNCVKGVEEAARGLQATHPDVDIMWAVAEAAGLKSPFWQGFPVTDQGEGDLAARLGRIYNRLKTTHDNVLLIGGDTPHIPSLWLANAIRTLSADTDPVAVIGPARDGGFYLLGANFASAGLSLASVEYSLPTTLEHLSELLFGSASLSWLPQLSDIDTKDDIEHVKSEITKYKDLLLPRQKFLMPDS
jgi:glycosyltransferase A (GT-A) superfamily protein (DUF2064 family)